MGEWEVSLHSCSGLDFLVQMSALFIGCLSIVSSLKVGKVMLDARIDWGWSSLELTFSSYAGVGPVKRNFRWFGFWALSCFLTASLHLACEIIYFYTIDMVESQQCVSTYSDAFWGKELKLITQWQKRFKWLYCKDPSGFILMNEKWRKLYPSFVWVRSWVA